MSNLRRIMQQELEALDRRMEHLAAERVKVVEAIKMLEGELPEQNVPATSFRVYVPSPRYHRSTNAMIKKYTEYQQERANKGETPLTLGKWIRMKWEEVQNASR